MRVFQQLLTGYAPSPILGDFWQILQKFLVVTTWRRSVTGSWWVETGMLLNIL